jgi:2-polyprenyl-6-methoxyphenol hydroxylase-like FAD-dependent oxidoreductase
MAAFECASSAALSAFDLVVGGDGLHSRVRGYRRAYARYEELLGPLMRSKQQSALRFAGAFAPKSRFALWMRNRILNLLNIGFVADLVGRGLTDAIALPKY